MFVKSVLVLVALAASTCAHIQSSGQCPTGIKGQLDFDNHKYLGSWYQYAANLDTESNSDCVRYFYEDEGESITSIKMSQRLESGEIVERKGFYTNDAEDPAKVNAVFGTDPSATYITSTDYNGYAVLYSCENKDENTKEEALWVLTREASPSANARTFLSEYLEFDLFQIIDPIKIHFTKQTQCEYAA